MKSWFGYSRLYNASYKLITSTSKLLLIKSRNIVNSYVNHAEFNAKFLVVGGGSGGITVASTLTKKFGAGAVWIVEPSEVRYS